ncbi:YlzJ-like family protein [Sutcliffiella rhizosphaerae]|uniref:Uncharacterized protein n=1 Tax=Sutcliffiella rhizosphaerae TaxID=2880967 RepID=A0ABN8A4R8_9BACI|nr:YlzJ-like family protein [Sutcliffiella rhizosphaerae]CAG9619654.1 hypothetical protein BACCIP111883_00422 [Sutcliffiella rhizosphaerae]
MILYTTMPQELIFPPEDGVYDNVKIIDYNGVSLIVQRTEMNTYQIVRNLSTDPSHYLNQEFSPGQTINFI